MLTVVTALVFIVFADPPERKAPPSRDELAAISARGRDLAGYDAAAWHASDAVQAKEPKEGSVVRYIARKTDKGWVVAFGKLDSAQNTYLIAYQATQGKDPNEYDVEAFDPPKQDSGFSRSAARAIDAALKDFIATFRGEKRPYNVAVLPAAKGELWVYLVPAPTRPGVWPLGGDVRYQVSADDARIIGKRTLHNAIIENEPPPEGEFNKAVMGFHTHILDDVPEDTDVFHVLSRKPAVPEIVLTKQFAFQVGVDGGIKYLGKAEEFFKEK